MRKLLFLLAILAGFTSCSKDEEYEKTFEVTMMFKETPEIYSEINGSPSPINGAVGVIYRSVGVSEYYALIEDSGVKQFCPVIRKEFPDVDVFRLNSDILVVVEGKRTIKFYWTCENNPEWRFLMFETGIGHPNSDLCNTEL